MTRKARTKGSLRVIGGSARGRLIRSVPGDVTRPITDQVKEALFNILGPDIQGAAFLDLFAGSGSVGIEALSRGAGLVMFVDTHRLPVATIHENLQATGLAEKSRVLQADAFKLLERSPEQVFDYAYVAPPQYKGMWKKALLALDRIPTWLAGDAWVIAQIHPVEYEGLSLVNLVEFDQRRYGSTLLVFFRKTA